MNNVLISDFYSRGDNINNLKNLRDFIVKEVEKGIETSQEIWSECSPDHNGEIKKFLNSSFKSAFCKNPIKTENDDVWLHKLYYSSKTNIGKYKNLPSVNLTELIKTISIDFEKRIIDYINVALSATYDDAELIFCLGSHCRPVDFYLEPLKSEDGVLPLKDENDVKFYYRSEFVVYVDGYSFNRIKINRDYPSVEEYSDPKRWALNTVIS